MEYPQAPASAPQQYASRSASFPPDIEARTYGAIRISPNERLYENLEADEHVALVIGRHWKVLAMPLLFGVMLAILPWIVIIFLTVLVPFSYFMWYAFVFIWFWYCFVFYYLNSVRLKWRSDIYIVTNERMIDFNIFGLFYKDVTDTDFGAIHEVTYKSGGILTSGMDVGDVILKTYDGEIVMKNIPIPAKVALAIGELVEEAHAEHPSVAQPYPSNPAAPAASH